MTQTTRLQLVFASLQFGDLVTTLIVLRMGGNEANPLVSHVMASGSLLGVLFAKGIALAIAAAAMMARRYRAIRVVNVFYAGVVLWNLFILAATLVQRHGH